MRNEGRERREEGKEGRKKEKEGEEGKEGKGRGEEERGGEGGEGEERRERPCKDQLLVMGRFMKGQPGKLQSNFSNHCIPGPRGSLGTPSSSGPRLFASPLCLALDAPCTLPHSLSA